tara:strand:- start:20130 stop:20591 length:462 start_codon:yes stop_codon:yes gene_type:complete
MMNDSMNKGITHANSDVNLKENTIRYAVDIVSAYIKNNEVSQEQLPALLSSTYKAVANLRNNTTHVQSNLVPAVPIEESITDDHIICLEDGKKLKMIKRHLRAVYGMSVEEYRKRWGLPTDYPTVAPNYAEKRSKLAKVIGLGVNGRRKKAAS